MAAAVPQPVMVGSPIGAPTADCPIYLDANSPVVLATPCLNWQPAPAGPGGQARMQLMTFQAVSAFLPPCSTSRTAVDQAAANAVNVLTVRLTDAAWSRILTELLAAQVFAQTANSLDELHTFMKGATIPTPANLEMAEWARDRVWDCRRECCTLSDFRAMPDTHLDLAYLEGRLRHYPDQYLAANILEGVRLDADVELQSVWVPHLTSLPFGYASVGKELRRLRSMGWYGLTCRTATGIIEPPVRCVLYIHFFPYNVTDARSFFGRVTVKTSEIGSWSLRPLKEMLGWRWHPAELQEGQQQSARSGARS